MEGLHFALLAAAKADQTFGSKKIAGTAGQFRQLKNTASPNRQGRRRPCCRRRRLEILVRAARKFVLKSCQQFPEYGYT